MKIKVLIVLMFFGLGIVSCKKEGCKITTANNFDDKAKVDDGSCQFNGSTYTSMTNSTKNNLLINNHYMLEVYIDAALIGVINVNGYSTSAANSCTASNVASKTLSWIGSSYKSFQVDYRNQATGVLVKSTVVTVNGNSCNYSVLSY